MKKVMSLDQPGDDGAMKETVAWCRTTKLPVRRTTAFQLKIGLINFYPARGTIFVDGIGTLPESGLAVLKSVIALPHRTPAELRTSLAQLNLLPRHTENAKPSLSVTLHP